MEPPLHPAADKLIISGADSLSNLANEAAASALIIAHFDFSGKFFQKFFQTLDFFVEFDIFLL